MAGSIESPDIAMPSFYWVFDLFVESATQKLLLVASAVFAMQGSRQLLRIGSVPRRFSETVPGDEKEAGKICKQKGSGERTKTNNRLLAC